MRYCPIHAMFFTWDGGWTWQPVAWDSWPDVAVLMVETLTTVCMMPTRDSLGGAMRTRKLLVSAGGPPENLT